MSASVPVSVALDQQAEIVRLRDEGRRLREKVAVLQSALRRSRDTFEDFHKVSALTGHTSLAAASEIARSDADYILKQTA